MPSRLPILPPMAAMKNRVASGICSAVVSLHDPMLALNFSDKLLLLFNGEVLGIIEPQRDSLEKMEKMLSVIYGNISLHRCEDKKGVSQLIMLREDF
jgi:ABC-type cobalamin/Fe3+-siderophores transport system ATPase subunit